MRTSWVCAFIVNSLLICGCTRTVQQRVAEYHPGALPTTQPVPKTAVYSIRFVDEKGKKTGGIPSSHRLLAAGENAGFDIDEEAGLIAVAGNVSFPINIPAGYGAVWSTTYSKPTQFSKEVSKGAKAVGKVTGYLAEGMVEGFLDRADDDDCDLDAQRDSLYQHLRDQRRAGQRKK